ncbi:thioredoxin family protein [bacterium]|nr:thioredoxin family protein [bacterium]
MRKLISGSIALLVLLAGGAAFAVDAPFADAQAMAASSGKPILVDFYATW